MPRILVGGMFLGRHVLGADVNYDVTVEEASDGIAIDTEFPWLKGRGGSARHLIIEQAQAHRGFRRRRFIIIRPVPQTFTLDRAAALLRPAGYGVPSWHEACALARSIADPAAYKLHRLIVPVEGLVVTESASCSTLRPTALLLDDELGWPSLHFTTNPAHFFAPHEDILMLEPEE